MNRNLQEIKIAIVKLENNLHSCVPFCCFGNDNKKMILVMLDVIKHDRSRVWINSTYLSISEMFHQMPDNATWQAAIDAREWLESNFEIEELLFKELENSSSKLFESVFSNR
ncbi:hypothetical protein A0256_19930 [Mucilaginibacter sp. PAMC 26640]|nr:hypothetical protein A0256_19930 [Mucilaginibacter sp. PAMC 26640]